MTNLKSQNIDEIIRNMVDTLGDKEFNSVFNKTASLNKIASDAFKTFSQMLPKAKDGVEVEEFFRSYSPGMTDAEKESATEAKNKKIQELSGHAAPGSTVPQADDCQDCMEGTLNEEEKVAAAFALNHLIKIADTLDKKGFKTLANIIDEAMSKVAEKK